MTLKIGSDDIRILVFKARTPPGGSDFAIPAEDILDYSVTDKTGKTRTSGSLLVDNQTGVYTSEKPVHLKDRILIQTSSEGDNEAMGAGPFGAGPMGGYNKSGDYIVTNVSRTGLGGDPHEIDLRVSAFADGIMSDRDVDFHDTNRTVSGQPTSILNQVINDNCPELSTARLPELDYRLDYFAEGKKANTVVQDIADRAAEEYGTIVTFAEGEYVRFEPVSELRNLHSKPFTPDDFKGEPAEETTDRGMINNIRVTGGIDDRNNVADEQRTVDTFVTVSESNALMIPIATKKSQISSVEIYTKARGDDAGEVDSGVRVRIQLGKADGSAPIDAGDPDADIIKSGEQKVAYDDDGYTTFRLGGHSIPDRQIWLILDTPGDPAGYDVGAKTDSNGNVTGPAFGAFFPKPVGIEKPLPDSVDTYRRKDGRIDNEALATGEAVRDTANAALSRWGYPTQRFEPEYCRSVRAHRLNVGEIVTIEGYEHLMVDGKYVVTDRQRNYNGPNLDTSLTFEGVRL